MSTAGLVGVGYEGRTLADFVTDLVTGGVTRLVDVRLNALSRKRGFSKRGLAAALADSGIAYEHRPELGNPKDNRAGFHSGGPERETARARFAELLGSDRAVAAMSALALASRTERVAVLCFEADPAQCHRHVILDAVASIY